ncbi:MAG TPA: Nif3-like dinuclear metal center hexameric protein [Thermoanaerobaculia bacterium]|jgi:dinuclear metal center YbgI/SA1388 family protein|nr:Nif3-like dinuclear metal center hexameric protein [Thermoanaerobaculia bacterium]
MATIDRGALVTYLDQYLDSRGRDYGPNGLQVEGKTEIRKLVTGVSSCQELFVRAREAGADAVLVHHGLFWEGMPRTLTGFQYRRVAELIRGEMSLIAYHLPLDRHAEVGNNAVAGREIGLFDLQPFGLHDGLPIGFKGRFLEPISAAELVARCRRVYQQEPFTFLEGPDPVSTLGIISGGAQSDVYTAISDGLDAYITGEVSEWVMNVAREARIHYLAAGHYATERLGIRALGEHLQERFGVEVEFIDVPNPV